MKKLVMALLSVFIVFALVSGPAEARVRHLSFLSMKHGGAAKHVRHAKHAKHVRRAPALPPIVVAQISVASQTMSVSVNGWPEGYWRVSTARVGFHTPTGIYRATRMARVYYSKKYDNAPMPNSVFFYGGNAIHGTGHISQLGRPASHGCIRLHPSNAAAFFDLVQRYGKSRTRIIIG
jgi:lipoprotein-anchoring transpeptidase ErfK/SrfK